jgi:hypothetical protein
VANISRRDAIAGLGAASLCGALAAAYGQTSKDQPAPAGAITTASQWMDKWISESRQPVGGLFLGRFRDPIYYLTKPIAWEPNKGQENHGKVSVPVGFVTDLASIPRVFWSMLRPDGDYAYPAIVHDYLYWFQTRSREESDTILKLGMEDFSIDSATIKTIYHAVRIGGAASWSENARLRNAGEKRILKRFPDDPRTNWADWKKLPDTLE